MLRLLGRRGGKPRGIVLVSFDNVSWGHAVNARWRGNGTFTWETNPVLADKPMKIYNGKVEFWDASQGKPATWEHVKDIWFYPTSN